MIMVVSKLRVVGPFSDANEAAQWIEFRMPSTSIIELPFVIHQVVDPDRYGTAWRDGFAPIGKSAARVVEALTVGGESKPADDLGGLMGRKPSKTE